MDLLSLVYYFPAQRAVILKSPLMVRGESARKGAREVKKATYMYEQHITPYIFLLLPTKINVFAQTGEIICICLRYVV